MKQRKMMGLSMMSFRDGCEAYLLHCRQRNLREATIKHYRQSYQQFYKHIAPDMPLQDFNESVYEGYVRYLLAKLDNDVSINSYLRDLMTTLRYLMAEGYVLPFQMKSIKVDKQAVDTYTDAELATLLKKPDIRACHYVEYQCWVMTNLLFSTGIRQRSLMNLTVRDVDLDNSTLHVRVTKSRKPLLIPLNAAMCGILREYLARLKPASDDEMLFTNVFGQPLARSTCYGMLYAYNKRRGVQTTGIHRYRHTFAKQWILSGGNVVALSRLLGHSNLSITQNYVNLLVSDLAQQVKEVNLLEKFSGKRHRQL